VAPPPPGGALRPADAEPPARLGVVPGSAGAISTRGGPEPLPNGLRAWIGRALQLDPRHSFESALDARVELDKVLDGEDDGEYAEYEEPTASVAAPPTASAPPPTASAPAPVVESSTDACEPDLSASKPGATTPEPEPF